MELLYTVEPLKGKQNRTTLWGWSWLVKSFRQKLVVCRAPWISQGKSIGLPILFFMHSCQVVLCRARATRMLGQHPVEAWPSFCRRTFRDFLFHKFVHPLYRHCSMIYASVLTNNESLTFLFSVTLMNKPRLLWHCQPPWPLLCPLMQVKERLGKEKEKRIKGETILIFFNITILNELNEGW